MGGSPTTTQNTEQQSSTNPWSPPALVLSGILGQLGGFANSKRTAGWCSHVTGPGIVLCNAHPEFAPH